MEPKTSSWLLAVVLVGLTASVAVANTAVGYQSVARQGTRVPSPPPDVRQGTRVPSPPPDLAQGTRVPSPPPDVRQGTRVPSPPPDLA